MSVQARNIYPDWFRRSAKELQRQGKTLTEIANELRANRDDVVQVLYWEKVA